MSKAPSLDPALYVSADTASDRDYMDRMAQQDRTPLATDPSKPRFTIVVGPSPFTMPRGWEFFLTSPYEGVSYISTVLHNAGYPVRIVDVRYSLNPIEDAYRQIVAGTDVLGIATFEDNYPFVKQLIEVVKDSHPSMPVLCGGSLVTSVPHIFMSDTKTDIAVISEAEITIQELMEAYTADQWPERLPHIRGIVYRDADGVPRRNPPRGQMPDLDSLPRMNLSLWPQYHDPRGIQPQLITSYSRGCKMDCSFCYRTTPQERVKSPEKFHADLTHMKKEYGLDFAFFVDLTFSSRKDYTMQMCEVIQDHDIRWTCLTRAADVDRPRLEAMKESGADIALYGVESLGKEILRQARKGSTENITLKAMHNTWDAGIRFGALMIVGLPGETEEDLEHACRWAEENQHITRVKYLSAMPGTTVYRDYMAKASDLTEIDHLNWLSIEQALVEDEFINLTGLPEAALRRAYQRLYDAYQPGPVMDFRHYPENFEFFHPSSHAADRPAAIEYAGSGWRDRFSSAGMSRVKGWEGFSTSHPLIERGMSLATS